MTFKKKSEVVDNVDQNPHITFYARWYSIQIPRPYLACTAMPTNSPDGQSIQGITPIVKLTELPMHSGWYQVLRASSWQQLPTNSLSTRLDIWPVPNLREIMPTTCQRVPQKVEERKKGRNSQNEDHGDYLYPRNTFHVVGLGPQGFEAWAMWYGRSGSRKVDTFNCTCTHASGYCRIA